MKILISACVMGRKVRWNGSSKLNTEIREWAHKHGFELVPVCPEHELFGTPRRPIRLEDYGEDTRAIMGREDVTQKLREKARDIRGRHQQVVGFIGIAKSPTCSHSAGVRGVGRHIKGVMHEDAPFPTTEINSLKTARDRLQFLDRIVKYISYNKLT